MCAVYKMHESGFAHNDIKLDNVFAEFIPMKNRYVKLRIKLIDLGFSCHKENCSVDELFMCTTLYVLPLKLDLLDVEPPKETWKIIRAQDIWAIGILALVIFQRYEFESTYEGWKWFKLGWDGEDDEYASFFTMAFEKKVGSLMYNYVSSLEVGNAYDLLNNVFTENVTQELKDILLICFDPSLNDIDPTHGLEPFDEYCRDNCKKLKSIELSPFNLIVRHFNDEKRKISKKQKIFDFPKVEIMPTLDKVIEDIEEPTPTSKRKSKTP